MELVLTIAVPVVVLIGALLIYISTRPSEFHIERSRVVHAPADVIFAIINDLHLWHLWSPYDKRDPDMKKIFDGSESGPGAIYVWNGNKNVGEGRMTILESKPGQKILMKLEFMRPFKATNMVTFALASAAGGTTVSWMMEGRANFMFKAIGLLMSMDKMCGNDFEQGLANLDTVAAEMHAKAGA